MGVLLSVHLHSRCIIGVVHLVRGVHLGSLWVCPKNHYDVGKKTITLAIGGRGLEDRVGS